MQLDELGPHMGAELGVEIGERLVEQEHLWLADQCAAERHALLLAAGELRGLRSSSALELQEIGDCASPWPDARPSGTPRFLSG